MTEVVVDGTTLTVHDVEAVARGGVEVRLCDAARARMVASEEAFNAAGAREILQHKWEWLVGGPPPNGEHELVRRFVEGHCAGVGEPLPHDEVRALLLCRANALAVGWSGVRPALVERLLELLRRDWIPVVPALGSVGAAGGVALAHLARVALGLGGGLWVDGTQVPAADRIAALTPLRATGKEALSLINGSTLATALGALAVARGRRVLRAAESACALTMEVVRADLHALAAPAASARNHPGVATAAAHLRSLLAGSELVSAGRRPDSFSVRCAPAVLGAARDGCDHVQLVVERELNSASDNPLVFPDLGVVEGGNFHGAPVALAMDHLKLALVQVAGIAERRVFRMTYGQLSGLPSFLVPSSGVNSGLMLAQYTAASLTSEAKMLAVGASIDTIPTVQHQEDHVSMGANAARSALEVVDRVADVVAIELLAAAQGLDLRLDADPQPAVGVGTREIHARVRARVKRWVDDRVLHPDLASLGDALRAGAFDA